MDDDNIGNQAVDEKQTHKKVRASLTLEFANTEARDEFVLLSRTQPPSGPPILCLDRILPLPHQFRHSRRSAALWLGKWTSAMSPLWNKRIEEYRVILDPKTVIYHFDLRNPIQSHAVIKNIFLNFNLIKIELRQNLTGCPYHICDGKICFINNRCHHQFNYDEVKTHSGNIVYSINRADIPHPVFQVDKAVEYLFETNPDRSEVEIQLAYIKLITTTSVWKWTSGRHEAKVKSRIYSKLFEYARVADLEILKYFVSTGSSINMRQKEDPLDADAMLDWEHICRVFLKVDEFFE